MKRQHKEMRNGLFILPLALAAGLLAGVAGCADDPSPVGSALIPGSDLVNVDSIALFPGASHTEKAAPFSFTAVPTTIAVGRSNGFEAWGFLRFAGFPDSLSNASLQAAEVRLQTLYHLGDSLGSVSWTAHKALSDWNRFTFVYDSLQPGQYDPTGTNINLGSVADTDPVTFDIDTSVVREWIRSVTDTSYKNYGLVLEPTNTTVIKGFRALTSDSVNLRPVLTIRFIMDGSIQEDTLVLTSGADKFIAGAVDTSFLSDSTRITVRGGAAYRGAVGVDVSPIPAHAAIHRAYLDLTLDPLASNIAFNEHDSLLALFAGVVNPVQIGTPSSSGGNTVYRFNVTEFVQGMVAGIGDGFIRIATYDEENTVGSFVLYGTAASNAALRPKITVLYSPTR